MLKLRLLSSLAFLIVPLAAPALADEGFALSAPVSLQDAWNNSVWVQLEANGNGGSHSASGIILREQKIGDKYFLFVLTAGHIKGDLNWPVAQVVKASNGIAVPRIFKNTYIPETMAALPGGQLTLQSAGPSTLEPLPVQLKFVWGFLSESPDASKIDAGFLVFEEDRPYPGLVPMQIADLQETSPGDEVFEIGFPAVALRPKSSQKLEIPEPGVMTKRFSQGQFVGVLVPTAGQAVTMMGASDDVLLGNSGGALINRNGHIIGVVSIMYSSEDNAWAYVPDAFFSVGFFGTDSLKKFVDENVEQFLKSL